jgi:hypothetical protein
VLQFIAADHRFKTAVRRLRVALGRIVVVPCNSARNIQGIAKLLRYAGCSGGELASRYSYMSESSRFSSAVAVIILALSAARSALA